MTVNVCLLSAGGFITAGRRVYFCVSLGNIEGQIFVHKGGDIVDNQNNRPNRLINEKSPYLLQHAYNPVQWFPWGEEAFEKARLENKPVFLSIGFS